MAERWEFMAGVLIAFFTRYGLDILGAIAILVFGLAVARWAGRAVRSLGERSARVDATLLPVVANVTRLSLQVLTLMAVLDKFGVDTTSMIAVVGAAGLAVALALKDTLADVASGIALLVLRPFGVGDAIDVDGTAGVVDAIDIFQTRLTSFDGVPVMLPNSKVRAGKIQNYSRAEKRRVEITIGISYSADIGQALAALRDVLSGEPRVLAEPAPLVNVAALGDSSVDVLVRFWTLPADFFTTKLDLTRRLKERLDAERIGIPFPQRELHIVQPAGAAPPGDKAA